MQVYRDNNLVSNNKWTTSAATDDYLTQISYDKNGNILTLNRNGYTTAQLDMDDMSYNYYTISGEKSNRLSYVTDAAADYGSYEDIKQGQTSGNYHYNKIGELIEDEQEDMMLEWRYGDKKLSKIYRGTNTTTPQLEFVYNPLGVRVAKIMRTDIDGTVLPLDEQTVTYYGYDANGQVMAVYESLLYHEDGGTTLEEQYIYGSSRVGVIKQNKTVYFGGMALEIASDYRSNTLGKKRYELTNHLGNVLSTISDRKVWNSTDSHYEAVVTMYADYYAGGMLMPGRNGGQLGRYLFNGMEHDGELSGDGNSYTTEYRQYDPRLMRWKSRDPLEASFPWQSPYVAFDNNPIYYKDPKGLAAEGGDEGEPLKKGDTFIGEDGKEYTFTHDESAVYGTDKSKNNFVNNSEVQKSFEHYDKNGQIDPANSPAADFYRKKGDQPGVDNGSEQSFLEMIAEWERTRGTNSEGGSHGNLSDNEDPYRVGKLGEFDPFDGFTRDYPFVPWWFDMLKEKDSEEIRSYKSETSKKIEHRHISNVDSIVQYSRSSTKWKDDKMIEHFQLDSIVIYYPSDSLLMFIDTIFNNK